MDVRRIIKTTLLATLFVQVNQTGFAYHKPQHAQIALEAIKEYNRRYTPLDSAVIKSFVKGVISEDYLINTVPKFFNQHFVNQNKTPKRKRNSANRRIKKLEYELNKLFPLNKLNEKKKAYKTLGKIVHYLQDMTNPSHAVPIFHLGADGFDAVQLDDAIFSSKVDPDIEHMMLRPWRSFLELSEITGQMTLDAMDDSITLWINRVKTRVPMDAFWKRTDSTGWFSYYGYLGNSWGNKHFYVAKHPKGKKDKYKIYTKLHKETNEILVTAEEYNKFTYQQVLLAREVTIIALRHVFLKGNILHTG